MTIIFVDSSGAIIGDTVTVSDKKPAKHTVDTTKRNDSISITIDEPATNSTGIRVKQTEIFQSTS